MPPEEDHQHLSEPLLPDEEENRCASSSFAEPEEEIETEPTTAATTTEDESDDNVNNEPPFSIQTELSEMLHLGFPLAVSFFCRMGMASTDSSFVGHITDAQHSAGTYLAASVLSDMVLSILITPPLAFNQVLNALVGQAMGSGNPQMAGIWLQQSCFWFTVTCLPCLAGLWFVEDILLALDFPAAVAQVAGTYAKYNVFWPVPNGLYQCMRFYFQAAGLPRPAMYNNLVFLVVNALLNWTFVFGGPFRHLFGWNGLGFVGAAISLSVSRTLQSVVYFWYMFVYKQHHKPTWPTTAATTTTTSGSSSFLSFLQHHTQARTMEFLKQSMPNMGTLLFQAVAGQATTMLVGRLGELSIAASSVLSTVTIPWSGSLAATCNTVTSVRVGYHLGRGRPAAARYAAWMVLVFITVICTVFSALFLHPNLRPYILKVATNDAAVLQLVHTIVPAMLVGTVLNLWVGNITSGVFGGQGRPVIATLLSLGLELPLSIGGVALYIFVCHGNLVGVYWWQAIAGGVEAIIVVVLLLTSNWKLCAREAQRRQEANRHGTTNTSSSSSSSIGADDDTDNGAVHQPNRTTSRPNPSDDDDDDDPENPATTAALVSTMNDNDLQQPLLAAQQENNSDDDSRP